MTVGDPNVLRNDQRRVLHAMGIQVWVDRNAPDDVAVGSFGDDRTCDEGLPGDMDWQSLEQTVAGCTRCDLHCSRTQTVFGVGNREADWIIIGEAPGADEDRQGEPFVGRAGQLLNEMLRAVGLARSEVYIANILKCRPPGNRDPKPEEMAACSEYLQRQVELIQPRVILAVGRISAQSLLDSKRPVGQLRGNVHHFGETGIPLVVTYHPAYLLRSPAQKARAWQDLCLAKNVLERHL